MIIDSLVFWIMDEIYCHILVLNIHTCVLLQMLSRGYQKVIVFEDDVRFQPYFNTKLRMYLQEADTLGAEWELL